MGGCVSVPDDRANSPRTQQSTDVRIPTLKGPAIPLSPAPLRRNLEIKKILSDLEPAMTEEQIEKTRQLLQMNGDAFKNFIIENPARWSKLDIGSMGLVSRVFSQKNEVLLDVILEKLNFLHFSNSTFFLDNFPFFHRSISKLNPEQTGKLIDYFLSEDPVVPPIAKKYLDHHIVNENNEPVLFSLRLYNPLLDNDIPRKDTLQVIRNTFSTADKLHKPFFPCTKDTLTQNIILTVEDFLVKSGFEAEYAPKTACDIVTGEHLHHLIEFNIPPKEKFNLEKFKKFYAGVIKRIENIININPQSINHLKSCFHRIAHKLGQSGNIIQEPDSPFERYKNISKSHRMIPHRFEQSYQTQYAFHYLRNLFSEGGNLDFFEKLITHSQKLEGIPKFRIRKIRKSLSVYFNEALSSKRKERLNIPDDMVIRPNELIDILYDTINQYQQTSELYDPVLARLINKLQRTHNSQEYPLRYTKPYPKCCGIQSGDVNTPRYQKTPEDQSAYTRNDLYDNNYIKFRSVYWERLQEKGQNGVTSLRPSFSSVSMFVHLFQLNEPYTQNNHLDKEDSVFCFNQQEMKEYVELIAALMIFDGGHSEHDVQYGIDMTLDIIKDRWKVFMDDINHSPKKKAITQSYQTMYNALKRMSDKPLLNNPRISQIAYQEAMHV